MTVEEEMLKAKAAYAKQLAKLNRKKAAEEKKITDRVLVLLKDGEYSELYSQLYEQAFGELTAEREERSRKAKAARQTKDAGTADLMEAEEEDSESAMSQY